MCVSDKQARSPLVCTSIELELRALSPHVKVHQSNVPLKLSICGGVDVGACMQKAAWLVIAHAQAWCGNAMLAGPQCMPRNARVTTEQLRAPAAAVPQLACRACLSAYTCWAMLAGHDLCINAAARTRKAALALVPCRWRLTENGSRHPVGSAIWLYSTDQPCLRIKDVKVLPCKYRQVVQASHSHEPHMCELQASRA
jgi:hypothetical protein